MLVRTRSDPTGDRCIISWDGALDLHTIVPIRSAIHQAIDDGWTDLTIDCGACSLIDSAGIGVLIGARRRLAELGGRATILASETVARTLSAASVDSLFIIEPAVAADGVLDG